MSHAGFNSRSFCSDILGYRVLAVAHDVRMALVAGLNFSMLVWVLLGGLPHVLPP